MQPKQDPNDRNVHVPPRDTGSVRPPARDAAARIMREQIDRIYDEDGEPNQPNTAAEPKNPYAQHHSENADHQAAGAPHWQQYHTAWQSYYQQYYERYYLSQLHKRAGQVKPSSSTVELDAPASTASPDQELDRDQAVNELRSDLMNKVRARSTKVRKSRHFMPIMAAVVVALCFLFLQYNSLLFATVKAYVSPGSINPANIILDPTTDTKVGPDPLVIIPKINVQAPVIYDVPSLADNVIEDKLHDGVVHYPIPGASSFPGGVGNTVILGHSSMDVFDNGSYKFIFVQLDKLQTGDTFYLNYKGTRYTYSVTSKKIIDPNQVSQLVLDTSKPMATLVTCVPPGTALKRLVVFGQQISPDPSSATKSSESDTSGGQPTTIPGQPTSFLQRLFGGN
jgi:sortase A